MGGLVEFVVGFEVKVDIDEVGISKKLEDYVGGDDGGNIKFY